MCLGVPGKLLQWLDREPVFGRGLVEFGGIQRECQMACVPEAQPGDYVVVHAGLAICLINEAEAKQTLLDLEMLGTSPEESAAPR